MQVGFIPNLVFIPPSPPLSSPLQVGGIPSLVIIDGTSGAVINGNARAAVSEDPQGADFPWRPLTVTEVRAWGPGG